MVFFYGGADFGGFFVGWCMLVEWILVMVVVVEVVVVVVWVKWQRWLGISDGWLF